MQLPRLLAARKLQQDCMVVADITRNTSMKLLIMGKHGGEALRIRAPGWATGCGSIRS